VFAAIIYDCFGGFKENPSKLLDSLMFLATVCSNMSFIVPTRTNTLQPFTYRVVDFLNSRPYLGYERNFE